MALAVGPTRTEDGLRTRIAVVRDAAGDRFERNLNLMAVGDHVPAYLSQRLHLSADDLARSGAATVALGGAAEMCDTLRRRRDALGISYLLVADELAEAFAPGSASRADERVPGSLHAGWTARLPERLPLSLRVDRTACRAGPP